MLTPLDRSSDASPPDPDRAHPLVYIESCLRSAHFLLAVYESHGTMSKALERLCAPTPSSPPPPLGSAEQARVARFASFSPSNTVPRSFIATSLASAYSPHLVTLSLPTRLRLTSEIASLYGRIGYRRKEAFVLRELAALCAEGVAGKSIEVFPAAGGTAGPSPIAEEMGSPRSNDVATPSALQPAGNGRPAPHRFTSGSIVRTTSDSAGNESIVRITEKVCEAFGIQVAPRVSREDAKAAKRKSMVQGRTLEIMESEVGTFGWPSLQVGVLKDAIGIAEALPGALHSLPPPLTSTTLLTPPITDYQAAIRFTVTALRSLSDTMPPLEQYELSQNIPRVFAAATRRGASFDLEYWGPTQLVMSLEVAKSALPLLPLVSY